MVIAPLKAEWEGAVLGTVERERETDSRAALRAVHDFHTKLARTRVLDPACGTGNFLYVALELMKRLEGEVLEVLADLGGQEALAMETETVHPKNFLGLELNARAAAIAELVLWLGYLQWQLRSGAAITDPVLERLDNIRTGDAVLAHDGERVKEDRTGTFFANPRRPDWPEADYIVGNPPFIGGKDLRRRLGEGYAEALWAAHPKINKSADLVMYWWDRAAELLVRKGTALRRFGFVTTNSITQPFSRRVIAKRLCGRPPISLTMAIPDHPWTKATRDAAAVRIAMTVAEAGERNGLLLEVDSSAALDSDAPIIRFREAAGRINANLTIGTDVTAARPLLANAWLCSPGVKLHGGGFVIDRRAAEMLGLGQRAELERYVRPYRHGRDITGKSRGAMVIDLIGLEQHQVRRRFPEIYQHLLSTVKPARQKQHERSPTSDSAAYLNRWWEFGKPRPELRAALHGLNRYIATVETAKHRTFQFLDAAILPDNMLVCVASEDAFHLGVLSAAPCLSWTYANCGLMGVAAFEQGHRFTKSQVFDPFPFPDATPAQRAEIAGLAEELDALRKDVLGGEPDLTMTALYNLRAKLRTGTPFDLVEQDQRTRGRIDILAELHDRIDAAVAAAYGWPPGLPEEEMVARLATLNAARRAEEQAGTVRWLRPNYQIARAGVPQITSADRIQIEAQLPAPAMTKPPFPRDAIGQTAAVLAELRGGGALSTADIASRFVQGRRSEPRISATLAALARLGHVAAEGSRYRLRKAA